MAGFFTFAGQFFMPVTQTVLWVLGLRERASNMDADALADAGTSTVEATDYLTDDPDQDKRGSFPQLSVDYGGYSGTTDWEVTLADPTINAPTKLSNSYARKSPGVIEDTYDLLVHVIVSDNNGLTQPQLEQAAMDSLNIAQGYFQGPATMEVSVDLISASSAQIEWSGTLSSNMDRLYFPLHLETVDLEGFEQEFDLQVPILTDDVGFWG